MYRFIETFLQVQFTAQWSRWVKMQRRTLFHAFRGQTTSVSLLTLYLLSVIGTWYICDQCHKYNQVCLSDMLIVQH